MTWRADDLISFDSHSNFTVGKQNLGSIYFIDFSPV